MMRWGLLALLTAQVATAGETPRRWLLVLGQNSGDVGDEALRYADDDARRVLEAMQEVGFVRGADSVALPGATLSSVRASLQMLGRRLEKEASATDQLFVYASSHADEGALHLAGSHLPLSELTEFIERAPVAVAMLVVDSCRSGSLTRTKGLRAVATPAVTVEAAQVRGRIVIGSSGADEYAQESDALGGSYFTHHFVSAIRGAADRSHDGVVTLGELYAYAYARTLESTFATPGGMQHPSYAFDLRGHEELVMSELRLARSRLLLEIEPAGQWQVSSISSGLAPLLLDKPKGRAELALPPGEYRIQTLVDGGRLARTDVLVDGGQTVVRWNDLAWSPLPRLAVKGGRSLITAGLGVAASTGLVPGITGMMGAEARFHLVRQRWLRLADTVALSLSYRRGEGARVIRFTQDEVEARAGPGVTVDWGRIACAASLEAGAILVFQGRLPDGSTRTGVAPLLGLGAELRLRLRRYYSAFLAGSGDVVLVRKMAGTEPTLRAAVSLGVAFEL